MSKTEMAAPGLSSVSGQSGDMYTH